MSGFTNSSIRRQVDLILPQGTNAYVGLFLTAPNDEGEGSVEITDGWYSRVTISDWLTETVGVVGLRKVNRDNVTFPVNLSGSPVSVVAIGIFDAATDGILLAWAPTRALNSTTEVTYIIADTDTPQIPAQQLKIGIRQDDDLVLSAIVTTEAKVLDTTDATPTTLLLVATLVDEFANPVESFVWCRDTGGGLDLHYKRRIYASYYRDPVSKEWNVDLRDIDGVATRIGLTTATADLVLSGNTVILQVIGELATNLTWQGDSKVRTEVVP